MSESIKVYVETWRQTKKAPFAFPEKTELVERREFDLLASACKEIRTDWGQYSPIVTFPAIERELKRIGALHATAPDTGQWFGIIGAE